MRVASCRSGGAEPADLAGSDVDDEIDELWIGAGNGRGAFEFQSHAADWATARACLAALRAHRAGVDDPRRSGLSNQGRALRDISSVQR